MRLMKGETGAGAIVCGKEDVLVGGVDVAGRRTGDSDRERPGTMHDVHSHGHIRASRLRGI